MAKKPADAASDQVPDEDVFNSIAINTLAGDLRDFILDRLRHEKSPLPWDLRGEEDQTATVAQVTSAARTWVHRAVTMIAGQGQKTAKGSLIKLVSKDGIQTQINIAASDPLRHELMDHVGAPVLIIIADPEEYMGERGSVKITKDQRDILDEPPVDLAAD